MTGRESFGELILTMPEWTPRETSKHQHHVIAHVIGTTALGSFFDGTAAHILLDIGFVWTIYVDGEMGLLPERVAVAELEASEEARAAIGEEIRALHAAGRGAQGLERIVPAPVECLIEEVEFYASRDGDARRLLVRGETANLAIETSQATGEIRVSASG